MGAQPPQPDHRPSGRRDPPVRRLLPGDVGDRRHPALKQVTDYFAAQGGSLAHAQQQAFTWIGQQVQTQAAFLTYIDVFWALMLISAAAVPLALTLHKVKLGGPAPVAR